MSQEAISVLKSFIEAMNNWELNCAQIEEAIENGENDMDEEVASQLFLKQMNDIFEKHCTPKERKYGRLGSYQMPPEYNSSEEILEVNEITSKKMQIITQAHTGFRNKHRYILLFQKNQWLLDYKEYWSNLENKWVKGIL